MRVPVVIVNFKAYSEVLGQSGLDLAKLCENVAEETGASIAIAPATPDLGKIAGEVKLPVLAQHFDPVDAGSRTGWTPLEAVRRAGASGSLLNHSERRIPLKHLKVAIEQCARFGMESVVCADTIEETKKVAKLNPDLIAIEPPELIGGDISVTTARPEVVTEAVLAVHRIEPSVRVLCGAGVKTGKDVRKAIELGTVGALLASGVVKAKDQRKVLFELAMGLSGG